MTDGKKKHHRSSPYPAFDLAAAIQKARVFEAAQGRNWVRVDAATATWGYKTAKSGPAARSLATVRGFGLFDHKGGRGKEPRKVRLSGLGRKILFLQPDDNPQRLAAVRQAATSPKIHGELLKEFPSGLPTDVAIENYLLIERNFNPNAVGILLREWKATYKYARLDEVGSIADEEEDIEGGSPPWQEPTKESAFGTQEKLKMPQLQSETRDHTIPLADGRMAILRAPAPFTNDDYRYLSTYLNLMKGALVDAEALHKDQEEPGDDDQQSDD